MAEWIYEQGQGENRALLIEGGRAVEAHLEVYPSLLQPGDVLPMQVTEIQAPDKRAIVRSGDAEAILEPVPPRTALKATLLVQIIREPMFDGRLHKRARARPAPEGAQEGPAPSLLARIEATGTPIRILDPHGPDLLEEHG